MQLLYGTTGHSELEQEYVISFDTAEQRWILQLAPRQHTSQEIIHMQISGATGHGPDRLVLETADGDRTEWQLSLVSQGVAAGRELQQTLDRLPAH